MLFVFIVYVTSKLVYKKMIEDNQYISKILQLEKENVELKQQLNSNFATSGITQNTVTQNILNKIDAFIYVADKVTFEVLYANDKVHAEFGNIIGKKCWSVFQKNNNECSFCELKAFRQNEANNKVDFNWENENLINHKWYSISNSIIPWGENNTALLQVMVDISDTKNKEIRLEYENENFNKIIKTIPNIIWRAKADAKGDLYDMYISTVAEKILKLKKGTIGNDWYKYFSYVHPDDLPLFQKEILKNIANPGNIDVKYRLINSDGENIQVYAKGSVIRIDENTVEAYGITIELSELIKQEKVIKDTEAKYKILFDLLPIPILLHKNKKIITANPAAIRFFEATNVSELVNKSIIDFIYSENENKELNNVFIDKKLKKTYSFKSEKIQTLKNNVRDVDILASTFNNFNENDFILVSITDITEINDAYRDLNENKSRLNHIIENANEAIFVVQNRIMKFFNKRTLELLDITKEELLNKDISPFISDEDKETELQRHQKRITGQEVEQSYYMKIQSGKGRIIHAKVNTQFITWNNERAVIVVLDDMTEYYETQKALQTSEKRYKTLFELAPFPIVVHKDKKVVLYNSAVQKYLKPEAENSIINKPIMDFIHPVSADIAEKRISTMMENRIDLGSADEKFVTPSGDIVDFEVSSVPIDYLGEKAVLVILNDITERNETENKLKELIATKDKFFTIIAHDLKNPFHQILGFAEMLLTDIDTYDIAQIKKITKYLNTSAENGYKLLENLLEWSKAQTGRIKFEPQKLCLHNIIREEIENFNPNAIKKDILLINNIVSIENQCVVADKDMLRTVFRNLISNAIKFTFPLGKISFSVKSTEDFYEISITDTGIGIPTEIIDKIFKVEESISTPGTNNEHGTGLGLVLCREFIEKNGGKISVESKVGKGSTFKFTLLKCK